MPDTRCAPQKSPHEFLFDFPQIDLMRAFDSPERSLGFVQGFYLRRLPAFDPEIVGDDAGAWSKLLPENGTHFLVEPREHVERDDRGGRDVGLKRIGLAKLDQVAHAFFLSFFA